MYFPTRHRKKGKLNRISFQNVNSTMYRKYAIIRHSITGPNACRKYLGINNRYIVLKLSVFISRLYKEF